MKKAILLVLTFVLFGINPVMANEWKMDPAHSSINFSIKHVFSTVSGNFSEFTGQVIFNPEQLEKSKFDFTVNVDSINTGISKRDNHLRSGDFFDAGKFPNISFQSTGITHKEGTDYLLKGKMTIRDVTKDIEVTLTYWGEKQNPFNEKEVVTGFDTRFSIARLDYGVGNGKFLKMGVVGGEVDIFTSLEMTRGK